MPTVSSSSMNRVYACCVLILLMEPIVAEFRVSQRNAEPNVELIVAEFGVSQRDAEPNIEPIVAEFGVSQRNVEPNVEPIVAEFGVSQRDAEPNIEPIVAEFGASQRNVEPNVEPIFAEFGVSQRNVPQSEFIRSLDHLSINSLQHFRSNLFTIAYNKGLAIAGSTLVAWRNTASNPLRPKLTNDVWTITKCLENHTSIPRTLLKGGKRRREEFEAGLLLTESSVPTEYSSSITGPSPTDPHTSQATPISPHGPIPPSSGNASTSATLADSSVVTLRLHAKDINSIKADISRINSRISTPNNASQDKVIENLQLEIYNPYQKVDNHLLPDAARPPHPPSPLGSGPNSPAPSPPPTSPPVTSHLKVIAWNCRGLANATPTCLIWRSRTILS